jgi:hypothetical protein
VLIYSLDNRQSDRDFLENKIVQCKAVVPLNQLEDISPGKPIVVQLSNRSKYKGKILAFNYESKKGFAEGLIEIIRQ